MCTKAIDYYEVLNKLREKLLRQDIQNTFKNLSRYSIDNEAKWLISGILAKEYTQRPSIANNIVEKYTQVKHADVKDISIISRELQGLQGDTFNKVFGLILNIVKGKENGIRTANLFTATIGNGDLGTIDDYVIEEIDYSGKIFNQFKSLMPNFQVTCEICNKAKPIANYTSGCKHCGECKIKHSDGKKSVLKSKISRDMAIESAKSIKKDI